MISGELIDELIRRQATFAAFREPGNAALAYVQRDPLLQSPTAGQACFVLAPFDVRDGACCIRPDWLLALDANEPLPKIALREQLGSKPLEPGHDRAGYRAAIVKALDAIGAGRLQKVVLARTIEADLGGITPGALFQAACAAFPSAFVALVRTDHYGLWLGASPERLLSMDGEVVEVDSLAGTYSGDSAPMDPAEWGPKEREEQAIVTEEVVASLVSNGAREVKAGTPQVKLARPVAHLHTRITAIIDASEALRLAAALHPTPAVGGRPRSEACALISALEPRSRGLYAGYWGPIESGRARLHVNIRCAELFPDHDLLHVGAGITAASDPDSECDEVERKARTWLDLIDAQRQRG